MFVLCSYSFIARKMVEFQEAGIVYVHLSSVLCLGSGDTAYLAFVADEI
jgi:hypothetical protein